MCGGDVAELTDAFAVEPDFDKWTLGTVLESVDRLVQADQQEAGPFRWHVVKKMSNVPWMSDEVTRGEFEAPAADGVDAADLFKAVFFSGS
ncbi:hypothetical protein OIT41_08615 [Arthrobacter sp. YA7-1]|uniref:hypothetical protein n=1 Tax=Arthrobacter sp. YA7-1 TaxID=2987701 RepID=UPI002225BF9C|nr:hypothetical protein [Arthrobacter sp. YA7-1]UYY83077.1 hypothetical protein OIT41_08615 [Arthrobacter sp. YA7-1]